MRKILTSRLFRYMICLVLICALLINVSPIKARADVVSGGLVAAGATGAVVSVPVAIAIGATLIALGIIADAASQNPYALQKLASDVGDALAAAGTYVKDGMVEMYRFITDAGEAVYYADSAMMEAVRAWTFDTGVVVPFVPDVIPESITSDPRYASLSDRIALYPYRLIASHPDGNWSIFFCNYPFALTTVGNTVYIRSSTGGDVYGHTYSGMSNWNKSWSTATSSALLWGGSGYEGTFSTPYDLTLGNVLSVPIDGTSARTWSETYANRGLYIASGGNQGAPDDGAEGNDGWKFLLPLAFLAGADLWAMSQADQWTGSTPPEFGDYSTEEELTVTPAPEFDGYQAIEIAPTPNTNPDPGTGTNPDPGTGTNPDPGTGTNPDPGTGTNPDPGTNSGSSSWLPPSDPTQFQLVDLSKFFPFCIPFDLFEFFKLLNSDPVAPVLHWEIQDLAGQTYSLTVDLSEWDSVALLFRRLQLFLFVTGLAAASRKFIKW